MDWNPPAEDDAPGPEPVVFVRLHVSRSDEYSLDHGIIYQRCGGGRRLLRKKIGGN